MVASCRRCGSINTRAVPGTPVDRLVAFALKQQPLFCNRCGWHGRVPAAAPRCSTHMTAAHTTMTIDQPATVNLAALDDALRSRD
jgi:hypothetical protein